MRHGKLSAAANAFALCVLAVAMWAGWSAAATLTGMTVSTEGQVTRIHVMLDEPVEYSHFTLADPARLFVDCRGVDKVLPKSLPVGEGQAGTIEASVWKGDGRHSMTRITVDLNGPSQSDVKQVDDGLVITLQPEGSPGYAAGGTGSPEEVLPDDATDTGNGSATVEAELTPAETSLSPDESSTAVGTTDTTSESTPAATATEPSGTTETVEPAAQPAATGSGDMTETSGTPDTSAKAAAPAATDEVEGEADAGLTSQDLGIGSDESATPAQEAPAKETPAEEPMEYTLPTPTVAPTQDRRETTVTSIGAGQKAGLSARGGPRVSLDIQGADIYTVLRSISEYSGVNIVMGYDVPTNVSKPVSFHLENVPWGEALEMVLRSAHLWYRQDGTVIRVDTEKNLREEDLARSNAARQMEDVMPLTTKIVEVVYANAAELKPTVEKSLTRRGVVEVDNRTNSLLVTDIAPRVDAAVDMIKHLDSQTPQIEIVAKLVDVDSRFSRELGVLWGATDLHNNAGDVVGDVSAGANNVLDPTLGVHFGLVRSWGTVSAVLAAMEQDNKANIISNPRVTTVNNREARILVGKKIPLIVLDEAGNAVTQLVTIGITLRVTPHINDNNRITLDLHPEVSDLASQATVQGGVIINTSEADTRVMVGNGETAVIGGLIRSNETDIKRGVPILKDIPLLGTLFSDTAKVKEKRELLIFVTPRILSSLASTEQ